MTFPQWGTPPWNVSLEIPEFNLRPSYDVVVIGGGLTGVSAAYHLASLGGGRVALLEADRIGAGASGRTGGIVLEGTAAGSCAGVDRCLPYLQQVVEEHRIACELRLTGCWELRHETAPAAAEQAAAEYPRAGHPEVLARLEGFRWRDGRAALRRLHKVAGGTIDPGALLAGLARAALHAGAELHERVGVVRLDLRNPLRLQVCNRTLHARHVVLALNAYTQQVLPLPTELQSALTFAVCTEPLSQETLHELGLDPPLPFYTVDLPYLWGRTVESTRVIFGAGLIAGQPAELTQIRIDQGQAASLLTRLESRIHQFHPRLANIGFTHRWAGPIAFTARRTPILSRLPQSPNMIVAAGCAGHGIALSVRLGALIAAALVQDQPLPHWGQVQSANHIS